jgi:hypothetical protein
MSPLINPIHPSTPPTPTHLVFGAAREALKVHEGGRVHGLHLLPVDGRPGARLEELGEQLHEVLFVVFGYGRGWLRQLWESMHTHAKPNARHG